MCQDVQKDKDLAQVVLRSGRANRADRCADDRRGLPFQRAVAVGPGCPVDGVLQHARNRVIVLGRHDQKRVHGADPLLQLNDLGGRILLVVLTESGDAIQLENVETWPPGAGVVPRRTGAAVVRLPTKTPRRCPGWSLASCVSSSCSMKRSYLSLAGFGSWSKPSRSSGRVNIASSPSGVRGHCSSGRSQYSSTPLSSGSRR